MNTIGNDIKLIYESCQRLLSILWQQDMVEEQFNKQFEYATSSVAYNLYANAIF